MKIHRPFVLAGLVLVTGTASAQLVSGAALERPSINAGESAKLTVDFDVPSGTNCGLRVHWGDGSADNFKINQTKDVPLVATHAYAKPGKFTVKVEPKTQGMTMKCGGANREVALNVQEPPKAEVPAKATKVAPAKAAHKPAKSASSAKAS